MHGYKPVDGATGCYRFIVASIVSYSKRFILLALPVPVASKPLYCCVERLLDHVQKLLPVEMVLLDRGFYGFRLIDQLQRRRLKHIILVPKKKAYQEILGRGDGTYPYTGTYNSDKTQRKIGFNFAVAHYQEHDWLFATNVKLKEPRSYVRLYKGRWGTETVFRVQDEVEIKTKTKDMRVRYLLFLLEALIYDLWQYFKNGLSFTAYVQTIHLRLIMTQIKEALDELLDDRETRKRALRAAARGLKITAHTH